MSACTKTYDNSILFNRFGCKSTKTIIWFIQIFVFFFKKINHLSCISNIVWNYIEKKNYSYKDCLQFIAGHKILRHSLCLTRKEKTLKMHSSVLTSIHSWFLSYKTLLFLGREAWESRGPLCQTSKKENTTSKGYFYTFFLRVQRIFSILRSYLYGNASATTKI